MGTQCNGMHAQHGQCLKECDPPQCKYYGSVKLNDPVHSLSPVEECLNIALRRFLHNHGNIAIEGDPK